MDIAFRSREIPGHIRADGKVGLAHRGPTEAGKMMTLKERLWYQHLIRLVKSGQSIMVAFPTKKRAKQVMGKLKKMLEKR